MILDPQAAVLRANAAMDAQLDRGPDQTLWADAYDLAFEEQAQQAVREAERKVWEEVQASLDKRYDDEFRSWLWAKMRKLDGDLTRGG